MVQIKKSAFCFEGYMPKSLKPKYLKIKSPESKSVKRTKGNSSSDNFLYLLEWKVVRISKTGNLVVRAKHQTKRKSSGLRSPLKLSLCALCESKHKQPNLKYIRCHFTMGLKISKRICSELTKTIPSFQTSEELLNINLS